MTKNIFCRKKKFSRPSDFLEFEILESMFVPNERFDKFNTSVEDW